MGRTKTFTKTIRHQNINFNQNRSILEAKFDLKSPHCYHITSYLFFQSEEDTSRIVSSVCKRFKTYIKYNMNCKKEIIILDYPNTIEQGEKFCISVEFAGLIDEEMTKSLLLDKAERMAMLLEEFTRTLNSNMIILTKSTKGNRK
ncbi:hypothetical protein [Methanobrevibacter sp.]|uniref:hypothetical protein n=1 Tax=Methanobrevibacter sp. TaxID=66852 RepID=UPI0038634CB5